MRPVKVLQVMDMLEKITLAVVLYPIVMLVAGGLLLAVGLIPENDNNNEQTILAFIGLPVWVLVCVAWQITYPKMPMLARVKKRIADFASSICIAFAPLAGRIGRSILMLAGLALAALVILGVLGLLWFGMKQII